MTPPCFLPSLGDAAAAARLVARARETIPAYRAFLGRQAFPAGSALAELPWTDKASYIKAFPYADLLATDHEETFTIFASSGSSGHSVYWPQLKASHRHTLAKLKGFLEGTFRIQERRTLAVVGLALGSWIGGEHISWALKSLALESPYPFAVFSPGSQHAEIIRMVKNADAFVDQIILFVCPSAIAHLHLLAAEMQAELPLAKLRYVVLGEPFPEEIRASLQKRAGLDRTESLMFSIYGSADTGTLGAESRASVALRRLLMENPELRQEVLGDIPVPPHFFHCAAPDAYLEVVGRELCVTRWQGLPLLRYNLHDDVRLVDWEQLRSRVAQARSRRPEDQDLLQVVLDEGAGLPDLLMVAGRADRALILCGTNLSETMLDAAVKSPELEPFLTGIYRASIVYEGDRQHLRFELEFKQGVEPGPAAADQVYPRLVQALGRAQPEFLDDWRNVYQAWDNRPEQRILQIHGVPWPQLSQAKGAGIKQRGIQA